MARSEEQTQRIKEIEALLKEGHSAIEVHKMGFAKSTVYDIAKRIKLPKEPEDGQALTSAGDPLVDIEGVMPDFRLEDTEKLWQRLVERQEKVESREELRYNQIIRINDTKPIAIAGFADLHMGGEGVDYRAIRRDTDIVAGTDGFYAIAAGDYNENWIGRLAHVQRKNPIDYDSEILLVESWLEQLDGKLLAVVAGNHDSGRWIKYGGVDVLRKLLHGAELLYDPDAIRFKLELGKKASWRFKVRHTWPGSSQYNPTHPIEKDPKFHEGGFDIGLGGHTHRGNLFRDFWDKREERRLLAWLTGTYKFYDDFSEFLGYPPAARNPTGCVVFWPDGRYEPMRDLQTAAEFLEFLRR